MQSSCSDDDEERKETMADSQQRGRPSVTNPEAEEDRDSGGRNPASQAMRAGRSLSRASEKANEEIPQAAQQAKEQGGQAAPRTLGASGPAHAAAPMAPTQVAADEPQVPAGEAEPVGVDALQGPPSDPTSGPNGSDEPGVNAHGDASEDLDEDMTPQGPDAEDASPQGGQPAGGQPGGSSDEDSGSDSEGDGDDPSDDSESGGGGPDGPDGSGPSPLSFDGGDGPEGSSDTDEDSDQADDDPEQSMGDVQSQGGAGDGADDAGGEVDDAGGGSDAGDAGDAADAGGDASPGAMAKMAAAAQNALNDTKGGLAALGAKTMGAMSGGGLLVARMVGAQIGSGAAAVIMLAMIASGMGLGGTLVHGQVQAQALRQNVGYFDACGPDDIREGQRRAHDNGDENTDATTEQNAKTVYSVLSAWGMPDENIAGILGNWTAESGIDPTSVETVFNERHQVGATKKNYESKDFVIRNIPELSGYSAKYPAIHKLGIGLGQWTDVDASGGRNTNLRDYAESIGKPWHSLETQLGFLLHDSEGFRKTIIEDMIAGDNPGAGSVNEATTYFHGARQQAAQKWFAKMPNWEADEDLANSILDEAETSVDGANRSNSNAAGDPCVAKAAQDVTLSDGGLTEEQAQAVMDKYNKEGAGVLNAAFGGGGPATCQRGALSGSRTANCTAFSWYFVYEYANWSKGYGPNNGIDTAGVMADLAGLETSSTPTAYSVGSGPGSGPAGHTFVVLGVNGDDVILGEAGYCAFEGRVRVDSAERLSAAGWEFTDISSLMSSELT